MPEQSGSRCPVLHADIESECPVIAIPGKSPDTVTFFRRLRCDRGVPACSNCVHRGDIVECHYVRRDRPIAGRVPPSPSQPLDQNAQEKLDHLERLVVSLLDEKRAGNQIATPPGSLAGQSSAHDGQQLSDLTHDRSPQSVVDGSSPGSGLYGSDHARWSVDEARWASLLNGVGSSQVYLTNCD